MRAAKIFITDLRDHSVLDKVNAIEPIFDANVKSLMDLSLFVAAQL